MGTQNRGCVHKVKRPDACPNLTSVTVLIGVYKWSKTKCSEHSQSDDDGLKEVQLENVLSQCALRSILAHVR